MDVWNLIQQNNQQQEAREPNENVFNTCRHMQSLPRDYERVLRDTMMKMMGAMEIYELLLNKFCKGFKFETGTYKFFTFVCSY
jgi:hypothetical protein